MTSAALLPWPAEAISQAAQAWVPGLRVEVVGEIDSTNSELMRRAHAGHCEPVLLVAQSQTAGRGRLGRSWHSEAGASLTFSIGLTLAAADWSGLSLAVGVSVALSLHADIRLKWPNDLWVKDHKLGGILIETTALSEAAQAAYAAQHPYASNPAQARYVVVGVGINIALPAATDLATPAQALRGLMPAIDAPVALQRIALPLLQNLQRFERAGFAPFASTFAARDALAGRDVQLSDGRTGVAGGIDESGGLRVLMPEGWVSVRSAEVSVRPALPL